MVRLILKIIAGFILFVVAAVAVTDYLIGTRLIEAPALAAELQIDELQRFDLNREFIAFTPESLAPGAALVIVLHGSSGSAHHMRRITGYAFETLAVEHGFAVVYPQGYERHWNGCRLRASYSARTENIDDIGFFTDLIDYMADAHDIDRGRVFVVGYSNGGHLAFRLAFEAPHLVGAIAVYSANLPAPANFDCEDLQQPLPVLVMNGVRDRVNPFRGGEVALLGLASRGRVVSAYETARIFVRRNQLPQAGITEAIAGTGVVQTRWQAPGRMPVVLYAVQKGGHTLPQDRWQYPRILGHTETRFDGPAAMWQFFQEVMD